MLRPRVIPCLLIHNKGLIKSRQFEDYKYVGDPLNTVRIFNEKYVDELVVFDIDCSVHKKEPDYNLISKMASECRMPLCYGGGITTVEQALKILSLGVEKISLSSQAIKDNKLITEIANAAGTQSVVVTLDYKKSFLSESRKVYIHNGKTKTSFDPLLLALQMEALGAGEIIFNSIDCDGMRNGYEIDYMQSIRSHLRVPMTILGGANSIDDLKDAHNKLGLVGLGAGSMFVLKGKHRAVLINYDKNLHNGHGNILPKE
jgi:imidazole glycerol-phosphate synthase subunit HisF